MFLSKWRDFDGSISDEGLVLFVAFAVVGCIVMTVIFGRIDKVW